MASHSYWRLVFLSKTSANAAWAVRELVWASSAGGAQLASGGTALGSSQSGSSNSYAKAYDGTSTAWNAASSDTAAGGWLGYQFTSAVSIAEVKITCDGGTSCPFDFIVQWSDNGSTWTDYAFCGMCAGQSTTNTAGVVNTYDVAAAKTLTQTGQDGATGTHTRWRILCVEASGPTTSSYGPAEIQFLDNSMAQIVTSGQGSAIAVSGTASVAFDGNLTNSWSPASSAPSAPPWIGFNWNTSKSVGGVKIWANTSTGNSAPTGWILQWSDDGSSYYSVEWMELGRSTFSAGSSQSKARTVTAYLGEGVSDEYGIFSFKGRQRIFPSEVLVQYQPGHPHSFPIG